MTTYPTSIQSVLEQFDSVDAINKELKRTASLKCRYSKHYSKSELVPAISDYEELLRQAKATMQPAAKTVTTFTSDDIAQLDWDQTLRALKSIQSKKSNTKWLTSTPGDNDAYRSACRIEEMLLEHKATLAPETSSATRINKSAIASIIEQLESDPSLDAAELLRQLI